MRRIITLMLFAIVGSLSLLAATIITIDNPEEWTYTELKPYVGQTIQFATPMYITNNYGSSLTISPRRIYSPTNQAYPLSQEYNDMLTADAWATISLSGVSGYHRIGEVMLNLTVKVTSQNKVSFQSCTWSGNTRADLENGYDQEAVRMHGEPNLIVCTMNLEYYLVESFGTGYGPDTYADHQKQRAKVSKALATINADVYGFVEIQQGQGALAELAADLTKNTGRNFSYINDGGSVYGSYTKAGFVYCTDKVQPYGKLRENNTGVKNRKKTQAFQEISTGEKFLLSVNHFKAKSGSGSGDNADQGDGQGKFNGDRVREAQSVIENYKKDRTFYGDSDILIMGDLNAYAMEDPITLLRENDMIDLHRAFHADSSYSYVYRGQLGYLDHALCNSTLYPQVTGMIAYHINSDESDNYTYDKSSDNSMFRCSDHDPIIVGLKLDSTATAIPEITIPEIHIYYHNSRPYIRNAEKGYYIVYRLDGQVVAQSSIESNEQMIDDLQQGLYIINVYGKGTCLQSKVIIY